MEAGSIDPDQVAYTLEVKIAYPRTRSEQNGFGVRLISFFSCIQCKNTTTSIRRTITAIVSQKTLE